MQESITEFFNKIFSVFSTFRFAAFLDIVLVTIMIYLCVRIIRETRAMQLVKGIMFEMCIRDSASAVLHYKNAYR